MSAQRDRVSVSLRGAYRARRKRGVDWPWLVLFDLARIDWTKGIGQVLASVVGYVHVEISGTVGSGEREW